MPGQRNKPYALAFRYSCSRVRPAWLDSIPGKKPYIFLSATERNINRYDASLLLEFAVFAFFESAQFLH